MTAGVITTSTFISEKQRTITRIMDQESLAEVGYEGEGNTNELLDYSKSEDGLIYFL